MKELYLRPHHGLCIQHYVGRGYDDHFVKNMNHIIHILDNTPNQKIILRMTPDILCHHCPNLHNGICAFNEKVLTYDINCLSHCKLYDGQQLCWFSFKTIIKENIIKPLKLKDVCSACNWLSLCEQQR